MSKQYTVERALNQLNKKINHKGNNVFANRTAALAALDPVSRFEGQAAWLIADQALFRFVDGTEDKHFVRDSGKIFWDIN